MGCRNFFMSNTGLVYIRVLIDQILGYAGPLLSCCFSIARDLHYKKVCSNY